MQDQTQPVNQKPAAIVDPMQQSNYVFKFLSYYFDKKSSKMSKKVLCISLYSA